MHLFSSLQGLCMWYRYPPVLISVKTNNMIMLWHCSSISIIYVIVFKVTCSCMTWASDIESRNGNFSTTPRAKARAVQGNTHLFCSFRSLLQKWYVPSGNHQAYWCQWTVIGCGVGNCQRSPLVCSSTKSCFLFKTVENILPYLSEINIYIEIWKGKLCI